MSKISVYQFCVILMLAMFLVAESENSQEEYFDRDAINSDENALRKYCGDDLSNHLAIVCQGVYNSLFYKGNMGLEKPSELSNTFDEPWNEFIGMKKAWKKLKPFGGRRFRRQTSGIVQECCEKACTLKEMRSYCGEIYLDHHATTR